MLTLKSARGYILHSRSVTCIVSDRVVTLQSTQELSLPNYETAKMNSMSLPWIHLHGQMTQVVYLLAVETWSMTSRPSSGTLSLNQPTTMEYRDFRSKEMYTPLQYYHYGAWISLTPLVESLKLALIRPSYKDPTTQGLRTLKRIFFQFLPAWSNARERST